MFEQVVDARDPLLYRSSDLEGLARELHASKSSLLLLNKADLLTKALRKAWANYFDREGVRYIFWSAKAAAEGKAEQGKRQGPADPTLLHSFPLLTSALPFQFLKIRKQGFLILMHCSQSRYLLQLDFEKIVSDTITSK